MPVLPSVLVSLRPVGIPVLRVFLRPCERVSRAVPSCCLGEVRTRRIPVFPKFPCGIFSREALLPETFPLQTSSL